MGANRQVIDDEYYVVGRFQQPPGHISPNKSAAARHQMNFHINNIK
jgi:hypothetical protein